MVEAAYASDANAEPDLRLASGGSPAVSEEVSREHEAIDCLLAAKWQVGDYVEHAVYGWSGRVCDVYKERDGSIWVKVNTESSSMHTMRVFRTVQDRLIPQIALLEEENTDASKRAPAPRGGCPGEINTRVVC